MTKPLFSMFPEVSAKEWKQKIQADLKGADYNETLIWKSNEGINVKPFYHQDTLENVTTKAIPNTDWNICETIFAQHTDVANGIAVNALKNGAESIKFIIPNETVSVEKLLKNIDLNKTTVFLELQFLSEAFIKNIQDIVADKNLIIQNDIIGNLARSGNWFSNLKADHDTFTAIAKHTNTLTVDTVLYQNAGANMVQQLAYGLAHINEYFNHLNDLLSPSEKQSFKPVFEIAVGSNYFFEIAKIRALRVLYQALATDYGFHAECHIYAIPTKRNKTIYDYNTNLLRTTTECMSAILGGANTIYNMPYDAIYHKNNEFGDRIARNQLLILKNESYFNRVKNPSEGSYYIETLTDQLAQKGLDLFKDIEANGGFLKQLKEGIIQRKIKESAAKEQEQFDAGKIILLGTNMHPNTTDRMANDLELFPFVKTNARKTLLEPIIERRLAEKIEQDRLKTE
ncbi:methylmalonyl-CoA mutase [Bizionia argentinensis JUB59]|uniref:Methylmalonyl-CoA mutase n=1 Tax=Bizionia argentinensis JUB59 TaxID=1046627 RepID=G2EB17_9FLAO|nr:methylmalonyl-CoA mutase subunit beta [Bizionia argentinensis]EGV44276.2 methylmalonyl-CoA mutase [Bizionia argentinensis JUB59]